MKCPRTGANMKEVEIQNVKVDVSEGCTWFMSRSSHPATGSQVTCRPYGRLKIDVRGICAVVMCRSW